MKVGIVGFAGSGRSTVFHWLTQVKPDPAASQRGQLGIAKIPDERLDWLSAHFKPKKTTPATIEFFDTPGLLLSEQRDNPRRLAIIRDADGLLVVLNGFATPSKSPLAQGADWGGVLAGELAKFRDEMLFADLQIVSNRISKVLDQLRKPRPAKQKEADELELALLRRVAKCMEDQQSLAGLDLRDEEEKSLRSFQLLLLKPELVLVNIADERVGQPLPAPLWALAKSALAAPAKLECELEELAPADRQTFMQELGLTGLSRDHALGTIFQEMGQIVFFTIGEDECRAWGIPKGADAVTGAGQIHTDFARAFVRAEVVSFSDFRKVGSLKEAKTRGVYRLEGKTYQVQDGDIMHILAST